MFTDRFIITALILKSVFHIYVTIACYLCLTVSLASFHNAYRTLGVLLKSVFFHQIFPVLKKREQNQQSLFHVSDVMSCHVKGAPNINLDNELQSCPSLSKLAPTGEHLLVTYRSCVTEAIAFLHQRGGEGWATTLATIINMNATSETIAIIFRLRRVSQDNTAYHFLRMV